MREVTNLLLAIVHYVQLENMGQGPDLHLSQAALHARLANFNVIGKNQDR